MVGSGGDFGEDLEAGRIRTSLVIRVHLLRLRQAPGLVEQEFVQLQTRLVDHKAAPFHAMNQERIEVSARLPMIVVVLYGTLP